MQIRSVKTLAVVFLLVFALAGCDKQTQSGFTRPPAPVSVVAAVKQDVPVYLDSVGKSVASEVVSIQPQVSGRITEIHFTDGAGLEDRRSPFHNRHAAVRGPAPVCRSHPCSEQGPTGIG